MNSSDPYTSIVAPTGIPGVDSILHGGLPGPGMHLVSGPAGSGKTTFALQFLTEGARRGEPVLFLTLSQNEDDLRRIAHSHDLSLDGVHVQELASHDIGDLRATEQTVFHTSEIELRETMTAFLDAVERVRPKRIVFDSVAELRLLAGEELGYRRRVLALRQYLSDGESTLLLLQPTWPDDGHDPMRDLVRGVVELDHWTPPYGEIRRSLMITKMRGATFQGGRHGLVIRTGGLRAFPRLQIETEGQEGREAETTAGPEMMGSGIGGLDDLLDGGLLAGSSALVVGPAGVGKSSLVAAFSHAAAERGERAAIFLFEERPEIFLARSEELGHGLRSHVRDGRVSIRLVDTGEISPGEFAHDAMDEVDAGATVVGIDSLTSYHHAMRDEDLLITQMHGLLMNLSRRGVLTLLTVAQHGVVGQALHGPDVSYLADNMMMLRHFEASGTLRKALSIVKRRYGRTEPSIREIHFGIGGIRVGGPLERFQGILTGAPTFDGARSELLGEEGDDGGGLPASD